MEALLNSQCASQSVGPANQLFALLVQTILAAQCTISPPDMWPKDYGPTALARGLDEYDFVIVGAGSAGSVVANRLSENPDWKVLLLEAGGDPPIESEIPFMQTHLVKSTVDWMYHASSSTGNNGNERHACRASMSPFGCYWPRGKMLGGSGAMNAMVYMRGNSLDYNSWDARGNEGWGWQDVLQYFLKSEDNQDPRVVGDGTFHSTGGYLAVSSTTGDSDLLKQLFAAIQEIGYEQLADFNADKHIGFGRLQLNTVNGTRCSPAKAFLTPIIQRSNLDVVKHALATKVEFDADRRASSVRFKLVNKDTAKKRELQVKFRKEAILSAGAVNTPQLLMLSGIGRKQHLAEFGIPVVLDLPVGSKLEDHVTVPLFYQIEKSTAEDFDLQRDTISPAFDYLLHRNGSLTHSGINAFTGFVNTENAYDRFPNVQYHVMYSRKRSGLAKRWLNMMELDGLITNSVEDANSVANLLGVFTILLKPKSYGRVRLQSANAEDKPEIEAGYLTHPDDVRVLVDGIRVQQRIMATEAAQLMEPELVKIDLPACGDQPYDSDAYWECYIREMTLTLYHPVGTAKMGPVGDLEAVVDPRLRVKGVRGLRVIDASIMPEIVSGNTNAAVLMIAEKASDLLKEDYGWKEPN